MSIRDMMGCRLACSTLLLLIQLLWNLLPGQPEAALSASLGVDNLVFEGIETNYAGDYDKALNLFQQVETLAPDHPAGAFYQASVLFWKNSLDPNNPRYDDDIRRLLERAIAVSQKRLDKQADDLDALHYMGLAYTYLGRMDAHRGRLYEGGVQGETGRKYLETAMQLYRNSASGNAGKNENAALVYEDIHFPYGAYVYFAGRLPRFLRMFNFLWFIPRGSAPEGIAALEKARKNSRLHHLGATHLLVSIYAHLEPGKTREALALSTELTRRFPDNPVLDLQQARLLLLNGKYEEARAHTRSILNKVRTARLNYDAWVLNATRLIIAEIDIHKGELQASTAALADIESSAKPEIAAVLSPQILLLKGMIEDLKGLRREAVRYYKAVLDQEDRFRNRMAEKEAQRRIEQAFSPGLPRG
ncbi:MAG: hypothetical protein ACOZF0_13110 [Thermodesulfobacteriota bacterium]